MRLICPNCDAQYEVDDAAIPEGGRDVQCSNCGHAWFQMHPEVEAEARLDADLFETPAPVNAAPAEPAPAPASPDAVPAKRRALDESVLAVLREEAEREAAVRRAEKPGPIETQADLGLVEFAVSAAAARRAAALVQPEAPAMSATVIDAEPRHATRRELLPDIEEINSTLRATNERRGDDPADLLPEPEIDRRRGFRSGFVLMITLAVLLALAYTMAPRIIVQFPASAGAMKAYVEGVDTARRNIDANLGAAMDSVTRMLGGDKSAEGGN